MCGASGDPVYIETRDLVRRRALHDTVGERTMPSRLKVLVCLGALAVAPTVMADAKTEANKQTVLAFYEAALNKKDADAAVRHLGPKYVQHNPSAADGAEGLKAFIQFLRDKFPQSRSEVKRVIAEGDHVVLHVHSV